MSSIRKAAFLILVALLYLFSRGVGDHGLLDPIEGINASVALNMVGRRNPLAPLVGNLPYLGKAMGFWWFSSVSLLLFGWLEFSVRFWSVVGGLGMSAASWFIARRMNGERASNYAAVMTGTSLLTYVASQVASPHALYACCVTAALAAIVEGVQDRRFFLLLHVSATLAFIVYGPMGVILPWLSLLLYAYVADQARLFLKAFFYWRGLLATVLLGGGYLFLLYFKNPTLLALMKYNPPASAFSSVSSTLLFLSAGFFPWMGLLPESLRRALPRNWNFILPHEKRNALLLIWVAVFLFFGISSRDAFLLAAPLPALASLCASSLADAVEKNDTRFFQRAMAVEILLFVPFLFLEMPWLYYRHSSYLRNTLMSVIPWMGFCFLFLFAGWYYAKTHQPRKLMLHLSLTALLSLLPLAGVFDLLAETASVRDVGLYLRNTLGQGDVLVQYVMNRPSLYFYTARESLLIRSPLIPGVMEQKALNDSFLNRTWEKTDRVFMIVERHQEIANPLPQEVYNIHDTREMTVLSNRRD
ncbi:MAG: glycosyltransferase family 39 protein [Synergistaceae bacterium]|nr:glycosyltransferase family 39 protein [Synergistaceae bacterium]